jgi:hypothetical protein
MRHQSSRHDACRSSEVAGITPRRHRAPDELPPRKIPHTFGDSQRDLAQPANRAALC